MEYGSAALPDGVIGISAETCMGWLARILQKLI
jgi:hypothetical protein